MYAWCAPFSAKDRQTKLEQEKKVLVQSMENLKLDHEQALQAAKMAQQHIETQYSVCQSMCTDGVGFIVSQNT